MLVSSSPTLLLTWRAFKQTLILTVLLCSYHCCLFVCRLYPLICTGAVVDVQHTAFAELGWIFGLYGAEALDERCRHLSFCTVTVCVHALVGLS